MTGSSRDGDLMPSDGLCGHTQHQEFLIQKLKICQIFPKNKIKYSPFHDKFKQIYSWFSGSQNRAQGHVKFSEVLQAELGPEWTVFTTKCISQLWRLRLCQFPLALWRLISGRNAMHWPLSRAFCSTERLQPLQRIRSTDTLTKSMILPIMRHRLRLAH